jgi:hypothetical protein
MGEVLDELKEHLGAWRVVALIILIIGFVLFIAVAR